MTIMKHKMEMIAENSKESIFLGTALRLLKDDIDFVKISLFCAKDCFNHSSNKMTAAQDCIVLVEKWLENPESVALKDLRLAEAKAWTDEMSDDVCRAAYNTSRIVSDIIGNNIDLNTKPLVFTTAVSSVISDSVNAFWSFTNGIDPTIARKKRGEYFAYIISLLRTTTFNINNLQTKGEISDKSTLMALLDELGGKGENIIVCQDNRFYVNYPTQFTVSAPTMDELVDVIWNNKAIIHYLEKLYKE